MEVGAGDGGGGVTHTGTIKPQIKVAQCFNRSQPRDLSPLANHDRQLVHQVARKGSGRQTGLVTSPEQTEHNGTVSQDCQRAAAPPPVPDGSVDQTCHSGSASGLGWEVTGEAQYLVGYPMHTTVQRDRPKGGETHSNVSICWW